MSIIKTILKVFNGSVWNEYYPKTSSDQVVHTKSDGTATTVQAELLAQNSAIVSLKNYKVLWSETGGYWMTENHTATLSDKISNQPHGIILVWKHYTNNAPNNYGIIYEFIPKFQTAIGDNLGHTSFLMKRGAGVGVKYLYISDNKIVGTTDNTSQGTISGITFNNNLFVLTNVLGI